MSSFVLQTSEHQVSLCCRPLSVKPDCIIDLEKGDQAEQQTFKREIKLCPDVSKDRSGNAANL